MNLAGLPELLLSWVKNQAALFQGDAGEQASRFQPGTQYDGKVLDQLANGRHLVQVGGQKLDMNLPANARAGDTVKLTFVTTGPRPTFLLDQAAPGATQQVRLSNTVQQVQALMRFAQSAPAQSAAPLMGNAVASNAVAGNVPGMTGTSVAGRPVPSPAATVADAAGKLVKLAGAAVPAPASGAAPSSAGGAAPAQAGGAAPANLAAAAAGARPIVANLAMIQNYGSVATTQFAPAGVVTANTSLLGQSVDSLRAAIPASTTLKPNALSELPAATRNLLPVRLSQTLSESGLFYEAHLARWAKGQLSFDAVLREPQAQIGRAGLPTVQVADLGGMPEQAAHLAGRQLTMLEGLPFQWQGLAWPGQWMEWLVQERPGGEGNGAAGEEVAPWSTELRLTMPRMGQVHAHLSLSGDRLGIRLSALDATTRDELRAALPLLLQGLTAAGLQAASLGVESAAAADATA